MRKEMLRKVIFFFPLSLHPFLSFLLPSFLSPTFPLSLSSSFLLFCLFFRMVKPESAYWKVTQCRGVRKRQGETLSWDEFPLTTSQLLFSKDSEEMNIHILWRNLVSIFLSLVEKTRRIHVYKSTSVLGLRILHPEHWGHFTQFLVICRQMFYFVAFWKYPFKNSNQFPLEVLSIL